MNKTLLIAVDEKDKDAVRPLTEKLPCTFVSSYTEQDTVLLRTEDGWGLTNGGMTVRADFAAMKNRLKRNNLLSESVVKAVLKGKNNPIVWDGTAGLGEDSFLIAAAGATVHLSEYNPLIAFLLRDGLRRALADPLLASAAQRMILYEGNTVRLLAEKTFPVDAVYLDPMFPERQKNGLIKKKFQLLHGVEPPCQDETDLFRAAKEARPQKIVVKRPLKAPFLAGVKPTYSLFGSTVRFDCICFT